MARQWKSLKNREKTPKGFSAHELARKWTLICELYIGTW